MSRSLETIWNIKFFRDGCCQKASFHQVLSFLLVDIYRTICCINLFHFASVLLSTLRCGDEIHCSMLLQGIFFSPFNSWYSRLPESLAEMPFRQYWRLCWPGARNVGPGITQAVPNVPHKVHSKVTVPHIILFERWKSLVPLWLAQNYLNPCASDIWPYLKSDQTVENTRRDSQPLPCFDTHLVTDWTFGFALQLTQLRTARGKAPCACWCTERSLTVLKGPRSCMETVGYQIPHLREILGCFPVVTVRLPSNSSFHMWLPWQSPPGQLGKLLVHLAEPRILDLPSVEHCMASTPSGEVR